MQMPNKQELSIITKITWRNCLKPTQQYGSTECADSTI